MQSDPEMIAVVDHWWSLWLKCRNVLSPLNIFPLRPSLGEKNTNHSDLSRRFIEDNYSDWLACTGLDWYQRGTRDARDRLTDGTGERLCFSSKSRVLRAAGVRFPDGWRNDKIIIDCLIITQLLIEILSVFLITINTSPGHHCDKTPQ